MGGVVGAIAGPIGAIGGSIIGGPIGGAIGGSLGQGIGGALTSSNAANTQAQGATSAAQIAANSQMAGLNFVAGQEAPYNLAGQQALNRYEQLLGLGGGGGTGGMAGGGRQRPLGSPAGAGGDNFNLSNFLGNLPGYQFEQQQGIQAIENSASARGGALTGNTLTGLQEFGAGLASEQFQQYMQQLAGLTGVGQAAASGVATAGGNLIPGAGASLASGVNAAAQYGAAGQLGAFNQMSSAFNSPAIQGGLQQLFNPGNLALSSGFPAPGGDIGSLSQAIINSGALP